MPDEPLYQIRFRALQQKDTFGDPVPPVIRLRRLLKFAFRTCGFRTVEMVVIEVPAAPEGGEQA